MPSPLFLLPYRAHAPPSTASNSTGPAALTYTLCGRAPGARQRTMVTATALYAYYASNKKQRSKAGKKQKELSSNNGKN